MQKDCNAQSALFGFLMLTLRPELQTPLVSQIVEGLRGMIAGQALKPGVKLPSIRRIRGPG